MRESIQSTKGIFLFLGPFLRICQIFQGASWSVPREGATCASGASGAPGASGADGAQRQRVSIQARKLQDAVAFLLLALVLLALLALALLFLVAAVHV